MNRILLLLAVLGAGNCFWESGVDINVDYDEGRDDDYDHDHDHDHDYEPDDDYDHKSYHDHDLKWSDEDHNPVKKDLWHASHDRRFDKLSSYIVKADVYSRKFCKKYTNTEVREIRERRSYKLIYSMPRCDPNNITVKIKHRALYIYGRQSVSENASKYFDLRILPDELKTQDASWMHNGTHVYIVIPYDLALKSKLEAGKICREVNENVLTVPNVGFLEFRFGTK